MEEWGTIIYTITTILPFPTNQRWVVRDPIQVVGYLATWLPKKLPLIPNPQKLHFEGLCRPVPRPREFMKKNWLQTLSPKP